MSCNWIKTSPSLLKGIKLNNSLDNTKFEHFLKRIVIKLKNKDTEIFTEEERKKLESIFKINGEELLFAVKTMIYILKRIFKFILMPSEIRNDLCNIGFNEEKIEAITKVWSSETSYMLQNLTSNVVDKSQEDLNFSWKLNSELSSDYHKRSKIPKAYLSISNDNDNSDVELSHAELHSIFLQFESIQNEIDTLLS